MEMAGRAASLQRSEPAANPTLTVQTTLNAVQMGPAGAGQVLSPMEHSVLMWTSVHAKLTSADQRPFVRTLLAVIRVDARLLW